MRLFHVFNTWEQYWSVGEHVDLPNVLSSYAYLEPLEKVGEPFFRRMREDGVEAMFLDSGAFSADRIGKEIELAAYERAVEKLDPFCYAALDVIGDAAGTRKNLETMVKDGFKPVPVYTYGAPWRDLEELLDDGYDYIAFGGLVGRNKTYLQEHFKRGFAVISRWLERNGRDPWPMPIRIHSFGVNSAPVMLAHPIYSSDTAAVMKLAAYGQAFRLKESGTVTSWKPHSDRDDAWRKPELSDKVTGAKQYLRRRVENALALNAQAEHITRVWAERGLVWSE